MAEEQLMSRDNADHYIAREVAKQRMADLERKIAENNNSFVTAFAEIKANISHQTALIEKQSESFSKATQNLRDDMDDDFAKKHDFALIEARHKAITDAITQKIDAQWSKLIIIVVTISCAASAVSWFISVSKVMQP